MSISMVLDKWTQQVHTTEWSTDVKANDKAFFVAMVYISTKQESYTRVRLTCGRHAYTYIYLLTYIFTYIHYIDSHSHIHSFSQN